MATRRWAVVVSFVCFCGCNAIFGVSELTYDSVAGSGGSGATGGPINAGGEGGVGGAGVGGGPEPGDEVLFHRDGLAFFDGFACPAGWTERVDIGGRALVGAPVGGAIGVSVGSALDAAGGTRVIDIAAAHTHALDPPAATTAPQGHNHPLGRGTGHDTNGGSVAMQPTNAGALGTLFTSTHTHDHSVDVNFGTQQTGVADVDVTMPYLQLMICQPSTTEQDVRVPAQAVGFFSSDCRNDWAAYSALQGRVAVGASSGSIGAVYGDPLDDLGLRTINDVPMHDHAVQAFSLTSNGVNHNHTLAIGVAHDDNGGTGRVQGVSNTGGTQNTTSNHQHALDVASFASDPTGAANVDVTMPYAQLAACRGATATDRVDSPEMPSGAILFFSGGGCPDGWAPYTQADGRILIGRASMVGTVGMTVGDALEDGGAVMISEVPQHSHSATTVAITSTDGHNHDITTQIGHDDTGGGIMRVQEIDSGNEVFTLPNTTHTHDYDVGGFTSSMTGSAAVDVTMPYLQLPACRKL